MRKKKMTEQERREFLEKMKNDFIDILRNHAGYFYTWFGTTHLNVVYNPSEKQFLVTVDDEAWEIIEKEERPRANV